MIPITAIDGARACMDYEGINPWYYDDVSEMRASAESEYTSYRWAFVPVVVAFSACGNVNLTKHVLCRLFLEQFFPESVDYFLAHLTWL